MIAEIIVQTFLCLLHKSAKLAITGAIVVVARRLEWASPPRHQFIWRRI